MKRPESAHFQKSLNNPRILRSIFCCLIFSILFLTTENTPAQENQEKILIKDIAVILEFRGRVLYRSLGEFTFRPVKKGQTLSKYSTLYTDSDGWVTLAYVGSQTAAVSVPPNSIYRLEHQLPISMLFRRGFSRSKNDFLIDRIRSNVLSKESELNVAGVQDTGEIREPEKKSGGAAATTAVRFGLRMTFEMEVIPILFPVNNLFLWIDKVTRRATTPIVFAALRSEPVQAYLWQIKPETKIVWSGLISKDARRIILTIDKSGTYLFQGFGQSGTSRTRSVRIVVGEKNDVIQLFPQGVMAGDTVLFQ